MFVDDDVVDVDGVPDLELRDVDLDVLRDVAAGGT